MQANKNPQLFSWGPQFQFEFLKISISISFLSTLHVKQTPCLMRIRREQPRAANPLLSPFLLLRLVVKIWCQLIKQPRSLQPGFSVFDILIVTFLGHIILCLIHRLKSSRLTQFSWVFGFETLNAITTATIRQHCLWTKYLSATPLFLNFSSLVEKKLLSFMGVLLKCRSWIPPSSSFYLSFCIPK